MEGTLWAFVPAVIAIVLVLCSVFIPVGFLGGLAGVMYRQFAVTIAIAVVIEKAGSGVALATTVVDIVNSYFTSADALKDVHGENELIP